MNHKKRQQKWKKEMQEGIKEYENKTGNEYNYYGKISSRESMKAPIIKEGVNYRKIIRFILFLCYLAYELKQCSVI